MQITTAIKQIQKEGRVSTSQGVSGYLLEAISSAHYETKPAKR